MFFPSVIVLLLFATLKTVFLYLMFFFILKCLLQFDISSIYVLLKMVQWKECR